LVKVKNESRDFFTRLDNLSLRLPLGFDLFGFLWNIRAWRRYFLFCVIASAICWAVFGWDSTWSQLKPFAEWMLNPSKSLTEVISESRMYYGTGNHFSAPVIYGTAFIILSLYLEGKGIKKSQNFILTSALSLFNIGVFEWTWNLLYSHLQNQLWTIQFVWKQATNLFHFTSYIMLGILTLIYLYSLGYKPNIGKLTLTLAATAIGFWLLWVFYPFPITDITVETTTGIWHNNHLFPQTMYTIDIDPTDGLAIGQPFHVPNDLLHAVNVFAKVFTTLAILRFCMVSYPRLKNVGLKLEVV